MCDYGDCGDGKPSRREIRKEYHASAGNVSCARGLQQINEEDASQSRWLRANGYTVPSLKHTKTNHYNMSGECGDGQPSRRGITRNHHACRWRRMMCEKTITNKRRTCFIITLAQNELLHCVFLRSRAMPQKRLKCCTSRPCRTKRSHQKRMIQICPVIAVMESLRE